MNIKEINRILILHSFYPLILSTILAGAFFAFRVAYSNTKNYSNLLWNLALAWLPYIASVLASIVYHNNRKRYLSIFLLSMFWLVFFPNAPYMVTDFYHLDPRPPIPLWFDISLIAIFAFTGFFLTIASLRSIHKIVEGYLGKFFGWLFTLIVINLASLGVYLGRFQRYNSWDILLKPKSIVREIITNLVNPLENLGFVGFTIMFSSILLVTYLMFINASMVGNKNGEVVKSSSPTKIA